MKKKIFIAAAVMISSTLSAQTPQKDSSSTLNEVVVTATKYPLKQSLTGKVVTVISKEELERNNGKSLTELLNKQAGLVVNGSTNVLGTNQDVYMRGASTGKTLVLIDGIPAYDASGISGAFDLNFISIDLIERVEILKGSQSTLYGSDAIAGVINIITKKSAPEKISLTGTLSAGSFGTYKTAAGINGTLNKTGYSLQLSRVASNGFSSALDQSGIGNFDKDGYNNNSFLANIRHSFTDKLNMRLQAQGSKYTNDADAGAFTDDRDYTITSTNNLAGIGFDYAFGKNKLHLNYNYNTSKRAYLDDSTSRAGFFYYGKGEFIGKSHFLELYSNISASKRVDVLVGFDGRRQITEQEYFYVSGFGPYETPALGDSARVNQFGAYASMVVKDLNGFNLELGGRYNRFSKYGDVFTYSINPSWNINKQVKFFANASSGFKAPSLYQVYSEYRNAKELDPEKSLNLEGGVQYSKEKLNLRAVYFMRNIKDVIIFINTPNFPYGYYANGDKQKDKGFELEAAFELDKVQFNFNYTNLDGKVETNTGLKDTSYFNLFRRPRQTLNLTVGFNICKAWNLNIGVQSISKRLEPVFGGKPIEMPSYSIWNVYSQYQVTKNIKAFVDLKNITDENYSEVRGYNSRRFNVMAGVNFNF